MLFIYIMTSTEENNVSYSLEEPFHQNQNITYNELLREVDLMEITSDIQMDNYTAREIYYSTNYIKKDLERIADYYEISKRKKRKDELIEDIVLFEKDPVNIQKTYQRKKLWRYIEEIKKDKYLRQFLILD